MPRSYGYIKEYEMELNELIKQGLTKDEIGKKLGFSYKQVPNFLQTKSNAMQTCDGYIRFYNNNCIQTKTRLTPLEKRSQYVT